MAPEYSLVLPIYNEEAVLPVLLRRLDALMDAVRRARGGDIRRRRIARGIPIVLEARARADARYRLVRLSRNFGHQVAITTGMERASGRAVIVMDADLQDPPEVVLEMIAKWKEGYEVVYAERLSRRGESRFKRLTADLFYRLLGRSARSKFRATSAISASSTAKRSTPFWRCRSATGSCAACSPGSASGKRWCHSIGRRARRERPNIR